MTLEFVGPLGVAIVGSRRALDLAWAALAAGGIVLLSPHPADRSMLGAGLRAGGRVLGRLHPARGPGRPGAQRRHQPALALAVADRDHAAGRDPGAGAELLDPELLAIGLAVALLSSAIPYSLELEALRSFRPGRSAC